MKNYLFPPFNYLFPPFKDDDDKIGAFDYLVNNLDNEGLVIFLGRLESTYDAIISKLSSENAVAIKDEEIIISLEDRIREFKDDEHIKIIEELKAEKYANTMFHAKEWFNNNPKCNKVYVFVLDADGVNDDGWIADSHAISTINDGNCVGSYVRKVRDN